MKPLLMDRLIEFGGRSCALIRRSARDPGTLRESLVSLQMAHRAELKRAEIEPLISECRELIAISVTSIRRATKD